MNWRERQALPGPQARWVFASVVPFFVDGETGEKIDGFPAPDQKWKFAWPRKGAGHTYRKYPKGWSRREWRQIVKEFPLVAA